MSGGSGWPPLTPDPKKALPGPPGEKDLQADCCEQGEMIEMGKASFAFPLSETVEAFRSKSS